MSENGTLSLKDLAIELNKFLKTAGDWDKLDIAIGGNVKIVKMPHKDGKADRIAFTLNPNNKYKATYFYTPEGYTKYLVEMTEISDKALTLLKIVQKLNGTAPINRKGLKF